MILLVGVGCILYGSFSSSFTSRHFDTISGSYGIISWSVEDFDFYWYASFSHEALSVTRFSSQEFRSRRCTGAHASSGNVPLFGAVVCSIGISLIRFEDTHNSVVCLGRYICQRKMQLF